MSLYRMTVGIALVALVGLPGSATQQIGGPQPVEEVTWALFDPECRQESAVLEVPCGTYGVFQFVSVDPADACDALTEGEEVPPIYHPPSSPGNFIATPVDPDLDLYNGLEQPITNQSSANRLPELQTQPIDDDGAYDFGLSTGAPIAPPGTPPVEPDVAVEWLGVIDYSGTHGISTSWLADKVSGTAVQTYLGILDDPAFDPLGEGVGDFHVLAKLCQLSDFVDNGGDPPRVVNMSFGRAARPVDRDDVDNVIDGNACDESLASCQIAQVLTHLTERGVTFVAAAGNHQELLFPAKLSNVLSAGMLDLNRFFDERIVERAWETPPAADALMPGNALCLRHWSAPAGASYSSAMLAGWIYEALRLNPGLASIARDLEWAPAWDVDASCYRLMAEDMLWGPCNPYIQTLFGGLEGANEESCWTVASQPAIELGEPGPPQGAPQLPSLDEWSEETLPTPESDPCLPCIAIVSGNDLIVDMSSSVGLPEGTFLDSVSLRVGSNYYPLALLPEDLTDIENGALSQLQLPGWGWLTGLGVKLSLTYQQKANPADDCGEPNKCYWTTTPLYVQIGLGL